MPIFLRKISSALARTNYIPTVVYNAQKMLKKLNLKLILSECLALIFIINGIKRFYVAYHGKLFDDLMNKDWAKIEWLSTRQIGQLFTNQTYWTLFAILIGVLSIAILNWKNKFGIINSIVVLIITIGISSSGFFSSGIINGYLNHFCGILAKEYGMAFLIGGMIILLVGVLILWKTFTINKKHCTQHSV